ncbi:MAG: hypothetical protein SGARI_000763 [Bacillariaceae sp.]
MAGRGQGHTTNKKKFGKNLNKLAAPPTAPAGQGGAKSKDSSDRNGLLLLSTKRPSSGTKASSSSAAGQNGTAGGGNGAGSGAGGMLSTKSGISNQKPRPHLGLHTESNTSTHDALMGVVVGASRVESQQQPDAWGVAEKQQSVEQVDLGSPVVEEERPAVRTETKQSKSASRPPDGLHDEQSGHHASGEFHGSNWDEYGGRDTQEVESSSPEVRPKDEPRIWDPSTAAASRECSRPRKLFDPNASKTVHNSGPSNNKIAESVKPKPAVASNDGSHERQLPVIQLASYDDQGRGNRGTGTGGPRMLFDPKSGSMVEVSSRGDGGGNSRNRKERQKKGKNYRDNEPRKPEKVVASKAGRKGKGGHKDDSSGQQRAGGADAASNAKKETRKGKITASRRLPRTCGVLFFRDKKGALVSVDKCDGDLGYGVHSIPGGKVRNSSEYNEYLQNNRRNKGQATLLEGDGTGQGPYGSPAEGYAAHGATDMKHDWVKPNEKIELVTGVEGSPTLHANASEWVPSQAMYPVKTKNDAPNESIDDQNQDNDDDHNEVDEVFGLGFDPTSNMDSMMQSPSMEPSGGLDAVDLASLSLEPALQGATKPSHSIFAFESGSTWGNSNAAGNNDWAAPTGNAFGSTGENQSNSTMPASFLSLSSGNAWGGFGTSVEGNQSPNTSAD